MEMALKQVAWVEGMPNLCEPTLYKFEGLFNDELNRHSMTTSMHCQSETVAQQRLLAARCSWTYVIIIGAATAAYHLALKLYRSGKGRKQQYSDHAKANR